jgi:hypothetical protein
VDRDEQGEPVEDEAQGASHRLALVPGNGGGRPAKRGLRSLLKFADSGAGGVEPCAVCQRVPESEDRERLEAEGWTVGEHTLCPWCQDDGWQFQPGSSLPSRRYGSGR